MTRKREQTLETSAHCATCNARGPLLLTFARLDGRGFVTLCLRCSPLSLEDQGNAWSALRN